MAKKLVLVESPAKAKTINKYLGKDYIVEATIGHVRNLPKSKLGVDVDNNYEPQFVNIRGKGTIIKKIKTLAAKASKVYIATDPDREGEAIAQDIAEIISVTKDTELFRVLFNEITKNGVMKGMRETRNIDTNLVHSQRARRVMDRIIGYKMSPFLWRSIISSSSQNLSAGRVQSVALRLICEREEEIDRFKQAEYWSILAEFLSEGKESLHTKLYSIDGKEVKAPPKYDAAEEELQKFINKHVWIKTETDAQKILTEISQEARFHISKISKRASKRNPSPPFITSSMQAEASKVLRFKARQTMSIAQKLYEGIELGSEGLVGLITYMRTDSTRVSDDIIPVVREFIGDNYGQEYVPEKPNTFDKKKTNVQDAHEAIRPTSLKYTPEFVRPFLEDNSFKLYTLIWKRFIASQMASAQVDTTVVDISAGKFLFKAYGQTISFDGFMKIYFEAAESASQKEMEEDEAKNEIIPKNISEGETTFLKEIEKKQHFTKPLPRYTESTLIKELEGKGIGRPSTYSMIVTTIQERGYVNVVERKLVPTMLGKRVIGVLVKNFEDIINVGFTAKMEAELDQIAQGESLYLTVMNDFYFPFVNSLKRVEESIEKIPCDKCGNDMIIKFGRFGRFLACSNYPECKNIKSLKDFDQEKQEPEYTGETCPKCSSRTIFRNGKFGRFIGCEKYPDCDFIKSITLGINCPKCKEGEVSERLTKTKKTFYGCTKYPACDFISWQKPVITPCPNGDSDYMEERYAKKKGKYLKCPVCAHEIAEDEVSEDIDEA
ncbi:MAG: type I DNA topoisomerase [Ignavibacteriales bacterium]|nr:type I DNA topoisomerase [Ignavibacteriales bacterium]